MRPQRRVINHLAPVSTRCTSFPPASRAHTTPLKGNAERKKKKGETSSRFFSLSRNRRRKSFRATQPDFLVSSLFSTEGQSIARSAVVKKTRFPSRRVESSRPPLLPRRGGPARGGLCKAVLLVARRRCSLREMHSRVHLHPLSAGSGIVVMLLSLSENL